MVCTSDPTVEDGILRARAEDAVRLSVSNSAPYYLPFCDERRQAMLAGLFRHMRAENTMVFGGYEGAERAMIGCFPPDFSPDASWFPITALCFRFRPQVKLSHREVLGTIMSKGVRRDKIGDILCGDGIAVVFADEEIAPFLMAEVDKIAGEGVTVTRGIEGELPVKREFQPIRTTVASKRLDCAVKALLGVSRDSAATLIKSGRVSVNHLPSEDVSRQIDGGDCLSIAGYGRFWVDEVEQETKKGRLVFCARKCL